ncbi:MAG: hypothetical protein JNN11_02935 [Candidatus Doudnabacteria bacterium]|nr:hypothetical protein [Candidatus Doudnabacteria bacterium]
MILAFHIISALVSLGFTSFLLFKPSKPGLNLSYALFAFTLTSGIALMLFTNASILHTCVSGLLYLTFVAFEILVVRKKLVYATSPLG